MGANILVPDEHGVIASDGSDAALVTAENLCDNSSVGVSEMIIVR